MKPTHFYYRRDWAQRHVFVTLEEKKPGRWATSDGTWVDTLPEGAVKPMSELVGREVEYKGGTGVVMEALDDSCKYLTDKFFYMTESGFMVGKTGPCVNNMVRVSWKTYPRLENRSVVLLPSWMPFDKLTLK